MRARVAKAAKGHVFEDRFMELNGLKLALAYRQAVKDHNEDFELIKTLNDAWTKRFENLFKVLYMYTNPQLYSAYEQSKELEGLREELKPESFPEVWKEIMEQLPEQIIVEEDVADPSDHIPKVDPETADFLAGFVPYKQKLREEGDDHGNG